MIDPTDPVAGAAAPPTGPWWGHPVREYTWPLEYAALLRDPVWQGAGVPAGDGRTVLTLPGFLAGDPSLSPMRRWLRRLGYRSAASGIRWNVECGGRAIEALVVRLEQLADRAAAPVTIIGHSRGGLFGAALAGLRPDLVAQVISLGSPLGDDFDIAVGTSLAVKGARALERARFAESRTNGCFTSACSCAYRDGRDALAARPVRFVSVVTADDGVVQPRACRVPWAEVREVRGTHIGLAFNPEVYRVLADVLAR